MMTKTVLITHKLTEPADMQALLDNGFLSVNGILENGKGRSQKAFYFFRRFMA